MFLDQIIISFDRDFDGIQGITRVRPRDILAWIQPETSTLGPIYPSLPGVEGALTIAREARRPTRGTPEKGANADR